MTLLQAAPGFSTAKVIRQSEIVQFNAGKYFAWEEIAVDTVRDLADVLAVCAAPEHRFLVIRGRPRQGLSQPAMRRKECFDEAARHWACVDLDHARVDGCDLVHDPESAVRAAVRLYLPDYFHHSTFFWQLSSRAGLEPGIVRSHLWFWLDRAIGDGEMTRWAKSCAPEIDDALFRQVQPHYIARPEFDGVQDPLSRRFGLIVGEREDVCIPENWFFFAPEPSTKPGTNRGTYEEQLSRLGDGEGLGGFHDVLLSAIWTYLLNGGEDHDWLKSDLRRRLAEAPAGEERVQDLARYGSDAYLDDSIRGALRKIEVDKNARLSREDLKRWATKISRRSNDREAELGEAFLKVCRGEVFAEPGQYPQLVPRMVRLLAQRFEDVAPESLRSVMSPSLQVMPGLDSESIIYTFRLEQQVQKKKLARPEADNSARIREAFQNGRDYPYTQSELLDFSPRRWLVQRGRSYYLRFRDHFRGPFTPDDVLPACVTFLSPAISAGVCLSKVGKAGDLIQKSAGELVREYGTVADDIVLDFSAQRTFFDEENRTVVEAPCPFRDIVPRYHHAIHYWLYLMAGQHFDKLLTWIAGLTYLDMICVALFLTGWPGSGKGMLALGLSRLWTVQGPTELKNVFGDFNADLARCPLTFADEKLPEDYRGWTKSADLRVHIQETQRSFRRKHLPNAKLLGATRTIVAANNVDVLSTKENLSQSDVKAITDRYFHIRVGDMAREFLLSIDTHREGWVDQDKIAEHALWVRDNHIWMPKGRFMIEPEDQGLHHQLSTREGVKSAVCQWLVSYILEPSRFHSDGRSNLFVRVRNKQLLVNVQGLLRCWDTYVTNERCPPTGILARALSSLCLDGEKADGRMRYDDERGVRVAYRVADKKYLFTWAEDKGFAESAQLDKCLEHDTPDRTKKSVSLN